MKEYVYVREVVIGALVLIVISLSLTLINNDTNLFSGWFVKSLVTGIFTIIGVAMAANFAAKNAINVIEINKQNEVKKLRDLHLRNQKIIVEHGDELISYLDDHNRVLQKLFDKKELINLSNNIYYLNAISFYIGVLLEEITKINSYDLDSIHDYHFRKLRKNCNILKSNPYLSTNLQEDLEGFYMKGEYIFHQNTVSVALSQIQLHVFNIRQAKIL